MKSVVSSKKIAEILGVSHNDVVGMTLAIMLKKPTSHKEFIPKDGDIKVTADGIKLLIDLMCSISGIGDLIDIVEIMTEGE